MFVGVLGRFGGISLRELGWSHILPRDITVGHVGVAFAVMVAHTGSLDRLVDGVTDVSLTERALCTLVGFVAAFTVQHKLGRWSGLVVVALVFAAYHGRFVFLGKLGVGVVLAGSGNAVGSRARACAACA